MLLDPRWPNYSRMSRWRNHLNDGLPHHHSERAYNTQQASHTHDYIASGWRSLLLARITKEEEEEPVFRLVYKVYSTVSSSSTPRKFYSRVPFCLYVAGCCCCCFEIVSHAVYISWGCRVRCVSALARQGHKDVPRGRVLEFIGRQRPRIYR